MNGAQIRTRRGERDISPHKEIQEEDKDAKTRYHKDDNTGTKESRPTSTGVTCFRCNKRGHYSRDCPVERLNSQRVPSEETRDTADEEEHPGLITDEDDLEGSQYMSDLDDYEDYRAMNDSEDSSSGDEIVYLQGMKTRENRKGEPETKTHEYRASLEKPEDPMSRPKRSEAERRTLSMYVDINGVRAYTMFDTGSTANAISPDFARLAGIPVNPLLEPVPLQLGCIGSRSSINFGAKARMKCGPVDTVHYVDIVNINKYDVIIGLPFMTIQKIVLNVGRKEIVFTDGTHTSALVKGEGHASAPNDYFRRKTVTKPKE